MVMMVISTQLLSFNLAKTLPPVVVLDGYSSSNTSDTSTVASTNGCKSSDTFGTKVEGLVHCSHRFLASTLFSQARGKFKGLLSWELLNMVWALMVVLRCARALFNTHQGHELPLPAIGTLPFLWGDEFQRGIRRVMAAYLHRNFYASLRNSSPSRKLVRCASYTNDSGRVHEAPVPRIDDHPEHFISLRIQVEFSWAAGNAATYTYLHRLACSKEADIFRS
eukprot:s3484_g7.t1